MTDTAGFLPGDPVKMSQTPWLGKVTQVGDVLIGVRPIGRKHTTIFYYPDELEICRCLRSNFKTPLGRASVEKIRAYHH